MFLRNLQNGVTTLVSVNRFGTAAGNGPSYWPKVSADGRFVVFTSMATDLVENYRPGEQGLFVRDILASTTTLIVSGIPESRIIVNKRKLELQSNGGIQPQGDRTEVEDYHPILSANGRFLAFSCYTDFVLNETGFPPEKGYLRDLYAGTTKPVRLDGNRAADGLIRGISADGRFVLWTNDIPTNIVQPFSRRNSYNLSVRDMLKQEAQLVTISTDGHSDARNSDGGDVLIHDGAISADGRFAVFVSRAINLAPEKTNIQFEDIFVRDLVAGVTKVVSVNAWGTASGNRQSFLPRISGDGRFGAFYSRASDLVSNDNDRPDFNEDVRDTKLGITTLASINRTGTNSANNWSLNPIISADGRRVVFMSIASDLVPYDTNGVRNLFAYTVPTQFGQVQFSASSYQANEADGSATITVIRNGGSEGSISIDYATSGGTASSRSNYTPAFGTLRFIPGETSKSFKVFITDDQIANGDKTVNLVLSNPAGGVTLGSQSTATLTIKDNDSTTSSVNPIVESRFYVRQHYLDFLNREPDEAGLQFWTNQIEQCRADAKCREVKRINVSAAFILSTEFQETGFLVYRMYKAAYGRAPTYAEFLADTQAISQGVVVGAPDWEAQLESNKQMFANTFAGRASFAIIYRGTSTAEYYYALIANTGVTPSSDERDAFLNGLSDGKVTREATLVKIADLPAFKEKEFNPAFVLMQYFGYLRRNPNDAPDSDFSGYNFWLGKLNQFGGNYQAAEMVKAFITSSEYRQRFGP